MEVPRLIENTARYYLSTTLHHCHSYRVQFYYYALNIGILLAIVLGFGVVLYYCNKGKLSDYEKEQKMQKDQQYVLSKIRYYKDTAAATNMGEIDPSIRGNHIEAMMRTMINGVGGNGGEGAVLENNSRTSSITNLPTFPTTHFDYR